MNTGCTKPMIDDSTPWEQVVDSGYEIHFACDNWVTIPMEIARHPQAMRDAERSRCPWCGASARIIQRVQRLRTDQDPTPVMGSTD